MGKRNTKKTTKTTARTLEAIRADIAVALEAEHDAVDACSKGDEKALARGWAAAERTNVLYRELAAVNG